jgi:hypothetical protein
MRVPGATITFNPATSLQYQNFPSRLRHLKGDHDSSEA